MPFKKGEVNYRRNAHVGELLERDPPSVADDAPRPIVARFILVDCSTHGEWLLKRLVARWPHLNEATFAGRLRSWIGSNSHHFIKGAHSVGLFRLIRTELDLLPIVEEIFLFTRQPKTKDTPSERDAQALYEAAVRWAHSLGASRVIIGRASDHDSIRMVAALNGDENLEYSVST